MNENQKEGFWQKIGGGSLTIAILFHTIILILGAVWIVSSIHEKEPAAPDFSTSARGNHRVEGKKAASTNNIMTPRFNNPIKAQWVTNDIVIPEATDIGAIGTTGIGNIGQGLTGNGPGLGLCNNPMSQSKIGVGTFDSHKTFDLITSILSKRCSKDDRLARLKEMGGTPACEEAVVKALRWFKTNQNIDGSWGTANKPAMTGLVLLAYFGHCETPQSIEFGDSCLKGITYLIDIGYKNDGKIASNFTSNHFPYEHAIATYALAEASTFCKDMNIPNLIDVTQKAGQYIIDNQGANGGWAYIYSTAPNAHTDVSIVGWQVQALRACDHTDIKFKKMKSTIDDALKYLISCQNDNGMFGYNGPNGKDSLTGVGVLCQQMWDGNSTSIRKGLKYIKQNAKLDWNTTDSDLYSHYYMSQAMMQSGGDNWKTYNTLFRDQILNNQNEDGSWKSPAGKFVGGGNEVYKNALCTLMLEVYYRFLNSHMKKNNDF